MTLRSRVLLGLAVVACVLVSGGLFVAGANEAQLLAQVDDQLRNVAVPTRQFGVDPAIAGNGVGNGAATGTGGTAGAGAAATNVPTVPPAQGQPVVPGPERLSPLYTGVVTPTGSVDTVFAPNLGGDPAPVPAIDGMQAIASADTGSAFTVGSVGEASRYRVLATTDQRTGAVVVVALPLDDVDAAVHRLLTMEAAAILAALAVLALVAWWVIRLGVQPVNDMAEAAAAIAGGDLSHRVPESDAGTEAGELGRALNGMLSRIEGAFDEQARTEERLRRFVGDASHELRTPVTTIRGYAELYRSGGLADADALDDAMLRTEQEAVRMGDLVEDLLLLARLDQGRPLAFDPVDLRALAAEAAADARVARPARLISVHADEAGLEVLGDEDRLRQVVANVVGNALVHTPEGTPIRIRLRREDDQAVLEIADDGPGMEPEVAGRAFERFYRADPSRARHQGGSGLGLAIVHDLVVAHGGRIELDTRPGSGTVVRVHLPLAPAPPDSAEIPRWFAGASQLGG